jgi:ATP-binding cassette, subfamily B, bacterial
MKDVPEMSRMTAGSDHALKRIRFLLRVLHCFQAERWGILRLLIVIGLGTLTALAAAWPMALLVDTVLVAELQPGGTLEPSPQSLQHARATQIVGLGVLAFVLRVAQEILNGWRGLLSAGISHAGVLRVRSDLFAKLQDLTLLFHRGRPQGDTIFRLTRDATGCQQVLNVVIEVVVAAVTLVLILAIMLTRSVPLTLVALAVVPLLLITNVGFGRILKKSSRQARTAESEFTSSVQRAVSSFSLTQAFGRQYDEHRRFSDRSQRNLDAWYDLHRQLTWYRICVGLIFGAGTAGIFAWGGWMAWQDQILARNPAGMTVGSLVVFVAYLGMLYDPLCKLSGAGANMLEGVAGMERVFEILDQPTAIQDAPGAHELPLRPRTLALNNVSFAYDPARPVLRNVSLEVEPGEMVAFVGGSGVGKSTILHLLCRFFDPNSGTLEIDGHRFCDVRLGDLRRHIAVVFQENLMLPTTIAENIAYGRPDAGSDDIRRAAEMAGAAEFIESLPEGYATELAEGGQNLSGGQRQRLAIARALLTEAPVILLDEPTSALDSSCEQLVIDTLRRLKGERTIVLVSHRLSAVTDCDRIFVMHEGHIVGSGSHEELMARQGWYFQTASRQLPRQTPAPDPAWTLAEA